MDPTELPYELQFQILLEWPYYQIVQYCQVNRAAAEICRSTEFWSLKARRDFQQPLHLIQAQTSAEQFRILSEILTSSEPVYQAIVNNQHHLIKIFNWDLDAIIENPDIMMKLAYDLERGNWSVLNIKDLNTKVYSAAIANGYWNAARQLSSLGNINYLDVLEDINYIEDEHKRNDAYIFANDDAVAHGHTEIPLRTIRELINCSVEMEMVCDQKVLEYLFMTHITKDDFRRILDQFFYSQEQRGGYSTDPIAIFLREIQNK